MWQTKADVIRHFLSLEVGREKYRDRKEEILSWINLPDDQVLIRTRAFADERDDTNPLLAYTVGTAKANFASKIAGWKQEHIKCAEIYTCGISEEMREDIDAVDGNLRDFALTRATKFSEFSKSRPLPQGNHALMIVVAQTKSNRKGTYELIDGAHRLIAVCRGKIDTVEAYVGHLRTDNAA